MGARSPPRGDARSHSSARSGGRGSHIQAAAGAVVAVADRPALSRQAQLDPDAHELAGEAEARTWRTADRLRGDVVGNPRGTGARGSPGTGNPERTAGMVACGFGEGLDGAARPGPV